MNDPQRQTCKVCLRPDKFDFHVPNEVWAAVIPPEFRNRVVCLACFDDFAYGAGVSYAPMITTIFFAGDAASFEFLRVNGVIDCIRSILSWICIRCLDRLSLRGTRLCSPRSWL